MNYRWLRLCGCDGGTSLPVVLERLAHLQVLATAVAIGAAAWPPWGPAIALPAYALTLWTLRRRIIARRRAAVAELETARREGEEIRRTMGGGLR